MCLDKNVDVLVVDDCEDNLFLIKLVLEMEGMKIRTASNGHDGLVQIDQSYPDLIILDLMMPDMSGIEFMEYLKQSNLPNIPILLLTANINVSQEKVKNADLVCFKPIDLDYLLNKVKLLVSSQMKIKFNNILQ